MDSLYDGLIFKVPILLFLFCVLNILEYTPIREHNNDISSVKRFDADDDSIEFLEMYPSPEIYPLKIPFANSIFEIYASLGICLFSEPEPTNFVIKFDIIDEFPCIVLVVPPILFTFVVSEYSILNVLNQPFANSTIVSSKFVMYIELLLIFPSAINNPMNKPLS